MKYMKCVLFFGALLLITIITLSIVLPLTLTKTNRAVVQSVPKCPDGVNYPKVDCMPDLPIEQQSQSLCIRRGCCWAQDAGPAPSCLVPYNYGYIKNKWRDQSFSHKWIELIKIKTPTEFSRSDAINLEAKVEMQNDNRVRIKVNRKEALKFH